MNNEDRKPTRLPLYLSAFLMPGAGQFAQRRWISGTIFTSSFLALLLLIVVRVVLALVANIHAATAFMEGSPTAPFAHLTVWSVLIPFLIALGIYVLGLADTWLAYRRHPNSSGGGEMWSSFITCRKGAEWATPVRLANSENIMDNRPAMFARSQGGVLLVHSSDGRTNGTRSAKQNDLYCSVARAGEPVEPTELAPLPSAGDPPPPVHPNEPEDLRRVRSYRMTAGGKTYQLLRGEFQGMDTITVGIKEVGGKKQLHFDPSCNEPAEEPPPVAAAADSGGSEEAGTSESA